MSQKTYINKDIYVGDTGKQLKEIETNGDLIALYGNEINDINSDLQVFNTTATATPENTTAERTILNRTINKGLYLFVCNLLTNNWGSSGRDFQTMLRLNGSEIMFGNQVLPANSYSNSRPMSCIIDVTSDNSTLTMVAKSSNTASYAVTASRCYLLKLKSSSTPQSDMITSTKIDTLISLLEDESSKWTQRPYVLYNDSTMNGANTNITLSDAVENYDYIEIYYRSNDNFHNSRKFYKPSGNTLFLDALWVGSTSYMVMKGCKISISGTTLTYHGGWENATNGTTVTAARNIYIYRIVGYKQII